MNEVEYDPRWEWHDVTAIGDPHTVYLRGRCKHLEVEQVTDWEGNLVAQLCRTCDAQLPPSGDQP